MSLVDRIGTFRGVITDHAVSVSSTGLPQWVAQLQAVEFYDDDDKVWVDWSDVDEREITAYLVLFSKSDKEIFHSKQIKIVTGWSGKSFTELNDMDMSNVKLQWRVKENTYEGNTNLQVEYIDVFDAVPGRSVRKLEKKELNELDAKYSNILKQTSGGPTPAKAPTAPKVPPKAPAKGAKKTVASAPPQAPVRPDLPVGKRTRKEAWENCVDMKYKDVGSEKLAQSWNAAIEKIAGKTPDSGITEEQWFQIEQIVLDETAAF